MGRDPLGADERRVSGRDWGDSPLKLEADLSKLDKFLKEKQKTTPKTPTEMSKLICEDDDKSKASASNKSSSYLDDENIIEK